MDRRVSRAWTEANVGRTHARGAAGTHQHGEKSQEENDENLRGRRPSGSVVVVASFVRAIEPAEFEDYRVGQSMHL